MNYGERIRQRRKELDISVDELADSIGKSRATVYRYENGDIEDMPIGIIEPLAKALRTTPDYLMGWDDDPIDYDEYDGLIPPSFNGNVKNFFTFEDACAQDVEEEYAEFNKFLQTIIPSEKDIIEKYRIVDKYSPKGKEFVDHALNREYELAIDKLNSLPDSISVKAAHNDYEHEPEEVEKMKEDISNLKRPD